MKTQLLLAASLFVSVTASAQSNAYYSKDNKLESNLCVVSANEGFSAARKMAAKHGIYLSRYSKSIL